MNLDEGARKVLREKLIQEKGRLEGLLVSFAKKDPGLAGDYDTRFPEMGTSLEESEDEVEEYGNLTAAEHELELRLKNINDALAKIEAGTKSNLAGAYGACERCGKDIGVERLTAIPEARLCATCAGNRS